MRTPTPAHEHVVRLGGRFVDPSEAKVSVLDRGWLLGDGVFATMRGYGGVCFRPERHLAAVTRGAEALGIAMPASVGVLSEIANEAAKKTEALDAYVGVTISRGAFAIIARPLDGTVACGTTSNLFVVEDAALVTPPISTGCRPGVTREAVLEIARGLGMSVREERIPLERLERASEAFFTSTRIECLPIAGPSRRDFPTTARLLRAFRELVLSETTRAA